MADEQQGPIFTIEKLYVKDLSVEVPGAPEIYLSSEAHSVELQLRTESKGIAEGLYEVSLTVTVTAKAGEKTAFLIEVTQAGVFQMRNIPVDAFESILGVACPNLLFPYAREVVSDTTVRAGFPPVVLQPVNFEQLYLARQQEADAAPHELSIQ